MKTIRRLGLHEWESKKVTDGCTYRDDSISGYASLRQVATKMILRQYYCIKLAASLLFLPKITGARQATNVLNKCLINHRVKYFAKRT